MENYPERVHYFIEKYSMLVEYSERLIFPKYLRDLPEDSKHWSKPRKFIHRLSHPFSIGSGSFGETMGFFVLIFLAQVNLGWGVMFLAPVLFQIPSLFSESVLGSLISVILAIIFATPLVLVTYYWWLTIFTGKKIRPLSRFVLLALELIFVWIFSEAIRSTNPGAHLINSISDIPSFLVSYIFFLIPSTSYILILVAETLGQILQTIAAISHSMRSMHDPLPLKYVEKLSIDEIPDSTGKQTWKINSLSLHEIQTLRKWAEANRESTDKRTLPTIVVIGFFALLASSETIRLSIIEPVVRFWWGGLVFFWYVIKSKPSLMFSWQYVGATMIIVLTLTLSVYLLKMFSRLFRNLAVQSLVIEACILAENSHNEYYSKVDESISSHRMSGFWGFVQSVIDAIR